MIRSILIGTGLLATCGAACIAPALSQTAEPAQMVQQVPAASTEPSQIVVSGVARTFIVFDGAPQVLTTKPLLLVLHGAGGSAANVQRRYGFDALARRNGFLVVYADSRVASDGERPRNWNDGRDVPFIRGNPEIDDVAFLRTLIDQFVRAGRADANRVYVVGASNGGMMTLRLSCELSDTIAAIGTVMASMPVGMADNCRAAQPMPAIFIRGDADDVVPFAGGPIRARPGVDRGAVDPMSTTLAFWRQRNGCGAAKPTRILIPDGPHADETRVSRMEWRGCRGGPIEYFEVAGGGHSWPGIAWRDEAVARGGLSNRDMDSATEIMRFLAPHRRRGK